MSVKWTRGVQIVAGACAVAAIAMAPIVMKAQAPAAGAAGAGAGRGGGAAAAAPQTDRLLWDAFDADKDHAVTRPEVKAAFDAWYASADSAKAGSVTQQQLADAINKGLGVAPAAPAAAAPAAAGGGRGAGGAAGAAGAGGGRGAAAPFVAGASTPGLNDPCGGRSQKPTEACPSDITRMLAALPATAPAKPLKARKVLIYSRIPSSGFQHSSIPLAAKTIEEMGKKTGAWTSTTTWNPADITAESLKQYDAIFLSSTTGCFFDDASDAPGTLARRKAFVDFVRSGHGVVGIHATGDSYHGGGANCVPDPTIPAAAAGAAGARGGGGFGGRGGGAAGPGGTLASVILRWSWGLNDKKLQANDQTLTKADMDAVADAWFNQLDPEKASLVPQSDFNFRIVPVITQSNNFIGSPGRDAGRGSWTDWNDMIGGFFKFHWLDPQHIVAKVDDKNSPLTSMFKGQDFDFNDETYTFSVNSSFKGAHVLTSIDYDKMSFMDKLKESNPRPDHFERLSWIKKEGEGHVFYMAMGHDERIYGMPNMMAHLLAGMQYALGDLKADDSPTMTK